MRFDQLLFASLLLLRLIASSSPHCFFFASLLLLHLIASSSSHCFSFASLLLLRLIASSLPHCFFFASLLLLHLIASSSPHCFFFASLLLLRLVASSSPHCFFFASLLLLRLIASSSPHCFFFASLLLHRLFGNDNTDGKFPNRPVTYVPQLHQLCLTEEGNDTCDTVPTTLAVTLPPGCNVTLGDTKVTTLNVGECMSEPCVLRDDKTPGQCCVPVAIEEVEVQCDGTTYNMTRVLSCGCGQCEIGFEVDVTGSVSIRTNISGISTIVPVNATLLVSGNDIDPNDTQTYGNGLFSFTAKPEAERIVVRFYQETNEDFLPQVVSIDVPRGVSTISREVVLQAKPEPVSLDASTGGAVNTSPLEGAPVVTIPANSIVDADGNPYNGTVKVYPTFADPRDLDSISDAPGDFSFQNEEGESQELQTNGVLGLFFEDENGNPLQLSGKTTLMMNAASLGINATEEGDPDSYAWTLDADTGKWKMAAPLKYVNSRRKKRDLSVSVSVTIVIPFPLPYINLDKPVWKSIRCILIIQVYADVQFTQPLGDMSLQVITTTPNGQIYLTYTRGYVNRNGRACVTVLCGYRHIIVMKPLLGQPIAHPTHHLPAGFSFTNAAGAMVIFK